MLEGEGKITAKQKLLSLVLHASVSAACRVRAQQALSNCILGSTDSPVTVADLVC